MRHLDRLAWGLAIACVFAPDLVWVRVLAVLVAGVLLTRAVLLWRGHTE